MSSVASLKYLVSLLSRSGNAIRQAVRGFGCCLYGSCQRANAIVDVAFGPGVLVRDTSSSLLVGRHIFLNLCGLALYLERSWQRLLCIHAYFFVICTELANFPEGVAGLNDRGFVCSPAVSEVQGILIRLTFSPICTKFPRDRISSHLASNS